MHDASVRGTDSQRWSPEMGVLQGAVLATFLFILFINVFVHSSKVFNFFHPQLFCWRQKSKGMVRNIVFGGWDRRVHEFSVRLSVSDAVRTTNHTRPWEHYTVIQREKMSALISTFLTIEAMQSTAQKFIKWIGRHEPCAWSMDMWFEIHWQLYHKIITNVDEWSIP